MSKHSNDHIVEMSKSFALESIQGVNLFHYRLLNDLPEDKAFGDKIFREDIDFQCFLNQCRQLERAITMGYNSWVESEEKQDLKRLIEKFKQETPYLSPLRNTYEHFDEYLLQRGRDKTIDTRGMRVYSIEYEKGKTFKKHWLNFEVDIQETKRMADEFYMGFLKLYKDYLSNHVNV